MAIMVRRRALRLRRNPRSRSMMLAKSRACASFPASAPVGFVDGEVYTAALAR